MDKYPFFQFVRSIQEDRSIEIAVDPTRFPTIGGQTADLYVVRSRSQSEWDDDPSLVDVRETRSR